MKFLSTLVFVVLAIFGAAAQTAKGFSPYLASPPKVKVVVLKGDKPGIGVRIEIYREIENGESSIWSGVTDANGTVLPPDLPLGRCRIFADSGEYAAGLTLDIQRGGQQNAEFRLQLTPTPMEMSSVSAQTGEARPIDVQELRGVVADPNWAVIPKAQLTLQGKKDETYREIQSVQTDERGRFDFGKQAPGAYRINIVAPAGFCRVVIEVKLSEKGWSGLRVAIPVAAYDAHPGNCGHALKIEQIQE